MTTPLREQRTQTSTSLSRSNRIWHRNSFCSNITNHTTPNQRWAHTQTHTHTVGTTVVKQKMDFGGKFPWFSFLVVMSHVSILPSISELLLSVSYWWYLAAPALQSLLPQAVWTAFTQVNLHQHYKWSLNNLLPLIFCCPRQLPALPTC